MVKGCSLPPQFSRFCVVKRVRDSCARRLGEWILCARGRGSRVPVERRKMRGRGPLVSRGGVALWTRPRVSIHWLRAWGKRIFENSNDCHLSLKRKNMTGKPQQNEKTNLWKSSYICCQKQVQVWLQPKYKKKTNLCSIKLPYTPTSTSCPPYHPPPFSLILFHPLEATQGTRLFQQKKKRRIATEDMRSELRLGTLSLMSFCYCLSLSRTQSCEKVAF